MYNIKLTRSKKSYKRPTADACSKVIDRLAKT